jgi:MFS family permease
MEETAKTLITLGILLLAGFLADAVGRRTMLPRVTLLVVFGFLIGPAGFGFLSPQDGKWYAIVTDMALVMIGFLLAEMILTVVVASTVLFEVVGPVLTRIALARMGETGNRTEGRGEE